MLKVIIGTILTLILTNCSLGREGVMPFHNLTYTSSRLQPINLNNTSFSFRVWINNGTSIERVFSVSVDSDLGTEGTFDEIGMLYKGSRKKPFYRTRKVEPLSGFQNFMAELDKMDLFKVTNQGEIGFPLHQPFSFYVVELKKGNVYHSFKFYSYFPDTTKTGTIYDGIEKMIREEFSYDFYK